VSALSFWVLWIFFSNLILFNSQVSTPHFLAMWQFCSFSHCVHFSICNFFFFLLSCVSIRHVYNLALFPYSVYSVVSCSLIFCANDFFTVLAGFWSISLGFTALWSSTIFSGFLSSLTYLIPVISIGTWLHATCAIALLSSIRGVCHTLFWEQVYQQNYFPYVLQSIQFSPRSVAFMSSH